MKKIFLILFLFASLAAQAQIYSGNTANNVTQMRYGALTPVPVIGDTTVALMFNRVDSTLYRWTNTKKTWVAIAGGGTTYTFAQSLSNSGGTVTLSGDNASPGNSMLYGTNGSGVKGWYAQPGGGGAVSGSGAANQMAYWTSSSVLSSDANNTWDGTTRTLNNSISGSSAVSLFSATATWNTTGVPTAYKFQVTNTASGTGSKIADFVLGATSVLAINKDLSIRATNGLLYLSASGSNSYISMASRSDIVTAQASLSSRATWTVAGSTTVVDPTNYTGQLFNAVSTTLPQLAAMYDATHGGTWQSNSSGNITFASVGGTTFTFSAVKVLFPASTTSLESLNVPEGTAPTSPANGAVYAKTSDHNLYWKPNGSAEACLSCSGGSVTASSTTTFTNKSGNISQWTNDASYLTAGTLPIAIADGSTKGIAAFNAADFNSSSGIISIQHDTLTANVTYLPITHLTATHDSIDFNGGSGTYTPTLTNTTNLTTSTAGLSRYIQLGNIIYVSISASSVTPTTGGGASTVLTFTIPVNTATTTQNSVGSGLVYIGGTPVMGMVNIVSASTGQLSFFASGTTGSLTNIQFCYKIN